MKELEERIIAQARVYPDHIIRMDSFLDHQLDIGLLDRIGAEFFRIFSGRGINKIVTVEASGIAYACMTARHFGVPVVFAKKAKGDSIEGGLYQAETYSYSYNGGPTLLIAKERLTARDTVLVIDDLLAKGDTLHSLLEILSYAGAKVAGVGVVVEKGFQEGGRLLRQEGVDLHSLAIIDQAEERNIRFRHTSDGQ